jgi:hypothetical protein
MLENVSAFFSQSIAFDCEKKVESSLYTLHFMLLKDFHFSALQGEPSQLG